VALLEGGYDLEALRDSTAALISALGGESFYPEAPGRVRPDRDLIDAMAQLRTRALD
ncbi:MAG: hypothetical protein HKL83_04385, partial [Acidimicrobiaceae bacterium]|nr:hypothetical protein [Acidimicrobiaceae bacterium]